LVLFSGITYPGGLQNPGEDKCTYIWPVKIGMIYIFLFLGCRTFGQTDSLPEKNNQSGRKWLVGGLSAVAYGGSFILLNEAWYKDFERTSFHTFNDRGEWLQMDKTGHAWSAYTASRINTQLWSWAGMSRKSAVLVGSATSVGYLLAIEYLDGRSSEWGWSWPDVAADVSGALLFAGQELGWKEQRISFKFSSYFKSYSPEDLKSRADVLFGTSLPERLLKDYNAQSYWLSFNLHSFFKKAGLPPWLNVSVGYGADGMYGGYENVAYDDNGT
jgi:uncharacterized protein YfiM (DUF2279 family)